jgi:transcription antitermination factor NusG
MKALDESGAGGATASRTRVATGTSGADAIAPHPLSAPVSPFVPDASLSAELVAMAALGMSGPVLDRRWHVMRLKSTLRRTALALLGGKLGEERVHAPMLVHPQTPQERRLGRPGRVEPLFGDYVFVAFDPLVEPWVDLCYVLGVLQLIRRPDGTPQPVPRGFVERLMEAGATQVEAEPAGRIPRGTEVRVVAGPLAEAGLVGTVVLSTTHRVRVLLDQVMGGAREVWLPADDVRPSAAGAGG